jgi:beta-phosphoglucomutase-like phosphatase (HAD superfamily)
MSDPRELLMPGRVDAVLFDMDGVLTSTAKIHAASWKATFDAFLAGLGGEATGPLRPFDVDTDYKLYVDGRLR